VPVTNRSVCFIGKAWALASDPFTWHQDPRNPVLSRGKRGVGFREHPARRRRLYRGGGCLLHLLFWLLQTKWAGLYRDDTIYHVATPARYQIAGTWYLYAQACPLPANGNYIDGQWDLWCIACDRLISKLPGCASGYIPGQPTTADAARRVRHVFGIARAIASGRMRLCRSS